MRISASHLRQLGLPYDPGRLIHGDVDVPVSDLVVLHDKACELGLVLSGCLWVDTPLDDEWGFLAIESAGYAGGGYNNVLRSWCFSFGAEPG